MWFKQGQIEVDGGDENDCGGDECGIECGDSHAEETRLAGIPFNTKLTTLFTPNNQSKPIVPIPFLSLLITSRYTSNSLSFSPIPFSFPSITSLSLL